MVKLNGISFCFEVFSVWYLFAVSVLFIFVGFRGEVLFFFFMFSIEFSISFYRIGEKKEWVVCRYKGIFVDGVLIGMVYVWFFMIYVSVYNIWIS